MTALRWLCSTGWLLIVRTPSAYVASSAMSPETHQPNSPRSPSNHRKRGHHIVISYETLAVALCIVTLVQVALQCASFWSTKEQELQQQPQQNQLGQLTDDIMLRQQPRRSSPTKNAAFPGKSGEVDGKQQKDQKPKSINTSKKDDDDVAADADGTFNGIPVRVRALSDAGPSRVHCVGDNYQTADAWRYRSCRFHFFCFNATSRDFQIYRSEEERKLTDYVARHQPYVHSSTTMLVSSPNNNNRNAKNAEPSVSIGGLNQNWFAVGMERMKWFPRVVTMPSREESSSSSESPYYYELPPEAVLMPFHSLNGANPGHFVWDDLLPLYTLLSMFRLLPGEGPSGHIRDLMPMRYVLHDGQPGLWASCDQSTDKKMDCSKIMSKFMPLLLGKDSRYQFTSTVDYQLKLTDPSKAPVSDLVCAKTGVAGIGALTDHGPLKAHGWFEKDYQITHNVGRGGPLYEFRNFMMKNLGVADDLPSVGRHPHRIVFSMNSSDSPERAGFDMMGPVNVVRENFPNENVETHTIKDLSLPKQVELASQTSVFVTLCGGGAVTAMFLPPGSSVILYYGERDGRVPRTNKRSEKEAMLDWDIFNSMSHLRVHWLPRGRFGEKADERSLVLLIKHELSIMESRAFQ